MIQDHDGMSQNLNVELQRIKQKIFEKFTYGRNLIDSLDNTSNNLKILKNFEQSFSGYLSTLRQAPMTPVRQRVHR